MRITVFGATGKVGRLVVGLALDRGYHVTAFVYGASPLNSRPNLRVVQGSVDDPATVEAALKSTDAVISALGSWGTPTKDVLSRGMQSIIPAMQKLKIARIISLTGADARATGDTLSFTHQISHFILSRAAGKILHDGEHHLRLLEKSTLDWTVIRSPIMKEKTVNNYILNNVRPMPWATISRVAVAKAMIDQLENSEFNKKAPYIHN